VLGKVVWSAEFEIVWEVEAPRKTFVAVSSQTGRAWIWPVDMSMLSKGYQVQVNSLMEFFEDEED
jgi:hypothetical protein